MIKKAVIPCAGKGTRMSPITQLFPKEMLPLNCKPAIWYILNECLSAGVNEVCIITSDAKPLIKEYVTKEFGGGLVTHFCCTKRNDWNSKSMFAC